ncbi:hypothetical protein BH09BAC1_BH09BAC1_30570 [soil metagenome]
MALFVAVPPFVAVFLSYILRVAVYNEHHHDSYANESNRFGGSSKKHYNKHSEGNLKYEASVRSNPNRASKVRAVFVNRAFMGNNVTSAIVSLTSPFAFHIPHFIFANLNASAQTNA